MPLHTCQHQHLIDAFAGGTDDEIGNTHACGNIDPFAAVAALPGPVVDSPAQDFTSKPDGRFAATHISYTRIANARRAQSSPSPLAPRIRCISSGIVCRWPIAVASITVDFRITQRCSLVASQGVPLRGNPIDCRFGSTTPTPAGPMRSRTPTGIATKSSWFWKARSSSKSTANA